MIDILDFRRSRVFGYQNGAGSVVVECHVGATIAMNRISWNVKAWDWVIEHRFIPMKDIPVRLGNTISGFATANGSKLEWLMDIRVQMTYI
jgi:hypothetical protein